MYDLNTHISLKYVVLWIDKLKDFFFLHKGDVDQT